MLSGTAFLCAFGSAVFYMAATFLMKYWGGHSLLIVLPLSGGALLLAAVFEIEALKAAEMARTFVVILALEFLLTVLCAMFILREDYGLRDLFAIGLVFCGIALLSFRERQGNALIAGSSIAMSLAERPQQDATPPAALHLPRSKGVEEA